MNNTLIKKCLVFIILIFFTGTCLIPVVSANTSNHIVKIKENKKQDTENFIFIDKQADDYNTFKPKHQVYGIFDEYGILQIFTESEYFTTSNNKNIGMKRYAPTIIKQQENNPEYVNSDSDDSRNLQFLKLDKMKQLDRKIIPPKVNYDFTNVLNKKLITASLNKVTEKLLQIKNGNTLYVGGSGQNNYTIIQDAIDAASSGDTVFVYDDSSPYYENLVITKSINLIGENSVTTIIDGSKLEIDLDTINITSDNVFINSFSIINNIGYYYEAAILITGDFVTISDCIIYDNSWIGIFLSGASNCLIYNCELFQNLMSIYLVDSNENEIINCYYYDNAEDILLFESSHNNKIINCTCIGNSFSGIHIQHSSGNYIENCTCEDGYGGIGLAFAPNTVLKDNIIRDNYKNFGIGSTIVTDFNCDIDTSNKINGKPIYYWINHHNEKVPNDAAFIGLVSCSNILVKDLYLENNFQGIALAESSNCTIEDCVFDYNDGHGIFFIKSNDNMISGCLFQNSFFSGVYLNVESNRNTFHENMFSGIRVSSVWIELSKNCFITQNFIFDGISAISLDRSGGNILKHNVMVNCGLEVDGTKISDYINDADTSNKINGKILYYYIDRKDIIIPADAGQVIFVNCSNCTISNLNLSYTTIGIELAFSSNNFISENEIYKNNIVAIDLDCQGNDYNTISKNIIHNNSYGIDVDVSDYNNILDNSLNNNGGSAFSFDTSESNNVIRNSVFKSYNGIYLYASESNTINGNNLKNCVFNGIYLLYSRANKLKENKMYNCGFLIYGASQSEYINEIETTNMINDKTLYYYLDESGITVPSDAGEVILVNCNSCIISNLNLSDGTIGIELAYSNNNTISKNTLNNNHFAGIYLESSIENRIEKNTINSNGYGIDMQLAFENKINTNKIQQNTFGFDIYLSDSNTFFGNNIYYNGYGMRFKKPCKLNNIHHNNFVDNSLNAWDENKNTNIWDDGKKGNYWNDYTTIYPDARKIWLRGIWNTPYDISGGENQDIYPLILPSVIPRGKIIYNNDFRPLINQNYLSIVLRLFYNFFFLG